MRSPTSWPCPCSRPRSPCGGWRRPSSSRCRRNREVAKAARRALYRLRSAGVAIPERDRPAEAPATDRSPAGRDALRLRQPARTGRDSGRCSSHTGPRRGRGGRGAGLGRARAALAQPRRDEPERLAEARPEAGDGAASPALGRGGPRAAGRGGAAAIWNPARPSLPTPTSRSDTSASRRRPTSCRRCRLPRRATRLWPWRAGHCTASRSSPPWLPPEPELKRLALRVDELRTSPLALSPEQQAEALRERVRAQAEEFFDERRRRLYARRLWAVAPALERRGAEHAGPGGAGDRSPAVPRDAPGSSRRSPSSSSPRCWR